LGRVAQGEKGRQEGLELSVSVGSGKLKNWLEESSRSPRKNKHERGGGKGTTSNSPGKGANLALSLKTGRTVKKLERQQGDQKKKFWKNMKGKNLAQERG